MKKFTTLIASLLLTSYNVFANQVPEEAELFLAYAGSEISSYSSKRDYIKDENTREILAAITVKLIPLGNDTYDYRLKFENLSDCQMFANGYLMVDDRPKDVADWGAGAEVPSKREVEGREELTLFFDEDKLQRVWFKPELNFFNCK